MLSLLWVIAFMVVVLGGFVADRVRRRPPRQDRFGVGVGEEAPSPSSPAQVIFLPPKSAPVPSPATGSPIGFVNDLVANKLASLYGTGLYLGDYLDKYRGDNGLHAWEDWLAHIGQQPAEYYSDALERWALIPFGGGGYILLENGVDRFLLEDASGDLLLEA